MLCLFHVTMLFSQSKTTNERRKKEKKTHSMCVSAGCVRVETAQLWRIQPIRCMQTVSVKIYTKAYKRRLREPILCIPMWERETMEKWIRRTWILIGYATHAWCNVFGISMRRRIRMFCFLCCMWMCARTTGILCGLCVYRRETHQMTLSMYCAWIVVSRIQIVAENSWTLNSHLHKFFISFQCSEIGNREGTIIWWFHTMCLIHTHTHGETV